ncbi:IDEAL domain-containing protein [Halobacillus yeomjeoni]|uniref:IDEAL domain-containing protein n=1 Tax=Halobacillus yeomjeoni TaxID=311194 RepID=A0A931HVZ8_9BACI|nr:IDEAL domain-containing protein [Halobacillus yeomjeoni]MBH0230692.1 IDEAL domain-containing protein [Halobacillus yeomjeoni]MCA0985225.1 IDEAL domain-containing protein [Halobacillus yeomjeoni]
MLNIKMLKPYYVKEDKRFIRVVLAYQYFSLFIDNELYQFVPVESREIIIDRTRKRVHNVFDIFVFQRGKKMVYVSVADLLHTPEFITHLKTIIEPYYEEEDSLEDDVYSDEVQGVIKELEKANLRRLIDHSIDTNDPDAFQTLSDEWNRMYS